MNCYRISLIRCKQTFFYRLHPETIKVIVSMLFVEGYQPAAPQLVPVIFPHWFDTILE